LVIFKLWKPWIAQKLYTPQSGAGIAYIQLSEKSSLLEYGADDVK
jgi:hypothetical protein